MHGTGRSFKVRTSCMAHNIGRAETNIFFGCPLDTEGNLSHIHSILRTVENIEEPEGLATVLSKIRGCVTELIHHKEYLEMQEKGLVSSMDHLLDILNRAKSYLTHTCHTRCQIPRTTQDGETYFVCKVPENYYRTLIPHIHSVVPAKVCHMLG